MATPTHFSKEDIGGEILPILTTGLYRDTLDALREYIQNSIDAATKDIELIIDPTTVTVSDSGHGMSPSEARRAIRLGISDKNPTRNIGFRGIGIYSAFNLCDSLEVYTKKAGSHGSRIVFNFGAIRKDLLKEQERRKQELGPKLYLEKLLESSVFVEDDQEAIIPEHGTRLILSNLLPDSYRQLQDWDSVVAYLQNVVPLPFHPEFRYGKKIEDKFKEQDYRIVPFTLQIGVRREPIYRPYHNDILTPGTQPILKFFPLNEGKDTFGFAWVCINGRRVIPDPDLRGLLLKKFDFSIGTRSYLERFFKRTVFHRRITGEVIIQHPSVLPNAARSDLENNFARHQFLESLATFVAALEKWANGIQERSKAEEVLLEVREKLVDLAQELPKAQRDKDAMLQHNVRLAEYERRLKTHNKTLKCIPRLAEDLSIANDLLRNCRNLITDALKTSKQAQKKVEEDLIKVVQSEAKSKKKQRTKTEGAPTDLVTALQTCGISLSEDAQRAIRIFESEFLLNQLKKATYVDLLWRLVDLLEEEL